MVSPGHWSRALFLIALFAITIHRPAMGEDWPPITSEERSMTSLPEQPGAVAVVLLREDATDDPHNNRTVYMRIKVLTEPGRRYADVEIPYSRRHFTIKDLSGRTVHSDGTIVPLNGKAFDKVIVRRKEHGFEQRYNVKSFTLPDVQVGSILEYRYELSYDDHIFFPPQWDVQTDLFQKKASFKFIPYSGYLRLSHDRVGFRAGFTQFLPKGSEPAEHELLYSGIATSRTAANVVDLQMTNIPPLTHEPDAPPEEVLRYRVNFFYMVGVKQEQYWKDEGKFWSKDVENFLGRKNGVAEAVTQRWVLPILQSRKHARSMLLRRSSITGVTSHNGLSRRSAHSTSKKNAALKTFCGSAAGRMTTSTGCTRPCCGLREFRHG